MQQPMNSEPEDIPHLLAETGNKAGLRARRYKLLLSILKILVGLVLLVLSLRGIQWNPLITGIRSANLTWLILAILAVLVGLALKLWRWAILVRNYHIQASFPRLFSAYFVGQATNILLPLRGGELVRLDILPTTRTSYLKPPRPSCSRNTWI